MQSLIRRVLFLMLAGAAVLVQAAPLPEASPEDVGMSPERLGRVVEVACGQALDVFLTERIFEPLKMVDTAFQVSPEKQDRIAQPLRRQAYRVLLRNLVVPGDPEVIAPHPTHEPPRPCAEHDAPFSPWEKGWG